MENEIFYWLEGYYILKRNELEEEIKIKKDFDMIVSKLSEDIECVNIYPLGDVHIGSAEFSQGLFDKWMKMVSDDVNGYVVIIGDMIDNGLKNSKTNVYEATMRPRDQKEWLRKALSPIKHKILGACRGNHEIRSTLESDDCPLYDVMSKLDLEDLYRENMAFLKVNLGYRNRDRQFSYTIVLAHGGSKAKTSKFGYAIDGMDILVTGHTHSPESNFPTKVIMDTKNEVVKLQDYAHIVVPSFAEFGGYALRGMYMPQSNKFPIIRLDGEKKGVEIKWV